MFACSCHGYPAVSKTKQRLRKKSHGTSIPISKCSITNVTIHFELLSLSVRFLMGAGCSKGAAEVVRADATTFSSVDNNNSVIKDTNVEHHEETFHPAETQNNQMEQEPSLKTSDKLNVKTEACSHGEGTANATEDQTTDAQNVGEQSSVLLASFCDKNPKLTSDLKATSDHYQALKEALKSGDLMTKAALEHVTGLFELYTKNGKPAKKVITDFAVALGIPKLSYDIIVDRRTNCKELTTWDREVDNEQETEGDTNESTSPESQVSRGRLLSGSV